MRNLLVAVILLVYMSGSGWAVITDSRHDLSSSNTGDWGAGGGSNTDETCVFCHTPHGAGVSAFAPLWNRSGTSGSITAVYGNPSGSLNATAATIIGANSTDAVLCLSCHDGTIGNSLTNPPNSLGTTPLSITATIGASSTLGGDLSNDHPIAISYGSAITNGDTDLVAVGSLPAAINLYNVDSDGNGTANFSDGLWCSSCHDVHNEANAPFLVVSNASSGLCTSCHVK